MGESRRKRYKKRLQVRFWRDGNENPHSGYTTNVSMNGMFVATNTPVKPNERVRVEIIDEDGSRFLHGEVVHAARVSPLLAKLRQAGMGIRLLNVDELIGELVGSPRAEPGEDLEFRSEARARTGFDQPAMVEEESQSDAALDSKAPSSLNPEEDDGWRENVSPLDPTLFSIRFDSGEEFLSAFRRELQHGGLFITTGHPPDINEDVTVEISSVADRPVRLPARVVSRRDAAGEPDPRNPPGINVDFKDLKSALEELKRLREIAENG